MECPARAPAPQATDAVECTGVPCTERPDELYFDLKLIREGDKHEADVEITTYSNYH